MSEVPWVTFEGPLGDEGPAGDYCMAVEGLHKSFGTGAEIFRDLHLRIRQGEIVIIVGESGIGKSVFLKHLIGLEEPTQGQIWYRTPGPVGVDCPVHLFGEEEMSGIRQEIAMVFQASSLVDWMTVFENISLPLQEHRDRLEMRFEKFLNTPAELWMLLGRAPELPDPFRSFVAGLAPRRESLTGRLHDLHRAFREPSQRRELSRQLAMALGRDQASRTRPGRVAAPPGSSPDPEDRLCGICSMEAFAELLAAVEPTLVPKSLVQIRDRYLVAKRRLHDAYGTRRASWGQTCEELATLLTLWWLKRSSIGVNGSPALSQLLDLVGREDRRAVKRNPTETALSRVLHDWIGEVELRESLPSRGSAGDRIKEIVRCLKSRPSLLASVFEKLGPQCPAVFAELARETRAFLDDLKAMERSLREIPEEEIWSGLAWAWLAGHPMSIDHSAGSMPILEQIIESFAERPEELGHLLVSIPAERLAPSVVAFQDEYRAFLGEFEVEYKRLLAGPRAEFIDAAIDVIVTGLMASLKLDVNADRSKLPSQLSGGMKTRVGLARALAMMPTVVLYDEPTAGLDPVLSKSIAGEILDLQLAGVVSTSVVVTHDKDLYRTLKLAGRTRMLYLSGGRFLDASARPVRDPLRPNDPPGPTEQIRTDGARGYPPSVFIEEFETVDPDAPGAAVGTRLPSQA